MNRFAPIAVAVVVLSLSLAATAGTQSAALSAVSPSAAAPAVSVPTATASESRLQSQARPRLVALTGSTKSVQALKGSVVRKGETGAASVVTKQKGSGVLTQSGGALTLKKLDCTVRGDALYFTGEITNSSQKFVKATITVQLYVSEWVVYERGSVHVPVGKTVPFVEVVYPPAMASLNPVTLGVTGGGLSDQKQCSPHR